MEPAELGRCTLPCEGWSAPSARGWRVPRRRGVTFGMCRRRTTCSLPSRCGEGLVLLPLGVSAWQGRTRRGGFRGHTGFCSCGSFCFSTGWGECSWRPVTRRTRPSVRRRGLVRGRATSLRASVGGSRRRGRALPLLWTRVVQGRGLTELGTGWRSELCSPQQRRWAWLPGPGLRWHSRLRLCITCPVPRACASTGLGDRAG